METLKARVRICQYSDLSIDGHKNWNLIRNGPNQVFRLYRLRLSPLSCVVLWRLTALRVYWQASNYPIPIPKNKLVMNLIYKISTVVCLDLPIDEICYLFQSCACDVAFIF